MPQDTWIARWECPLCPVFVTHSLNRKKHHIGYHCLDGSWGDRPVGDEVKCEICGTMAAPDMITETPDGKTCPTCVVTYYPEIADA